jgi:hypothetical protein
LDRVIQLCVFRTDRLPACLRQDKARTPDVVDEKRHSGVYVMRGFALQRPIMQKFLLILTALAAATLLGNPPAQAYEEGPWCAVVSVGEGSVAERCHFRDFETCRLEVVSGNRGFCNHNPRWPGYYRRRQQSQRHPANAPGADPGHVIRRCESWQRDSRCPHRVRLSPEPSRPRSKTDGDIDRENELKYQKQTRDLAGKSISL